MQNSDFHFFSIQMSRQIKERPMIPKLLPRGCGGSVGMWWLSGDVAAQWGCGGSVGMWWLSGDVVAQWGCGGSVRGCGGSVG
jgi:hypothetical protein